MSSILELAVMMFSVASICLRPQRSFLNGGQHDVRCPCEICCLDHEALGIGRRLERRGGTRSDVGRACRDGFIGLGKTSFKLGVGFQDYLGARLNVPGCQLIAPLPELILAKARSL
jgi:hypothetical protein